MTLQARLLHSPSGKAQNVAFRPIISGTLRAPLLLNIGPKLPYTDFPSTNMNTAAPDPPLPHKIYYNDLIILNILNIISFVSRLDDLKSVMVVDKWGFQAAAAKAYEDRDEVEREAWVEGGE